MATQPSPQLAPCMWLVLDARFYAKTKRTHCGCLEWTGAQSRGGQRPSSGPYGSFWIPGINAIRSHVYAAWRAGIIPSLRVPFGMNLDHSCTNTLCVEPDHLSLISAFDNQTLRWTREVEQDDDVPF